MTAKIKQQVVSQRGLGQRGSRGRIYGQQRGSVNPATLSLLLGLMFVVVVAGLSLFYLGQVLGTAVQGSDVQSLEERIGELKDRQRDVELEGARLRSIESIEQRVKELNLVGTSHVTFLTDQQDKVAALGQ